MGNVVIANVRKRVEGGRQKVIADLTYSNSYATNGDVLVVADLVTLFGPGASNAGVAAINGPPGITIEMADFETGADGTGPVLDRANAKLKAFSGRAEVANATNLSAITVKVEFLLRQATG